MVLAFLPVVSGLGVDVFHKAAVVMVIAVIVVIVVVVGVVAFVAVPMLLRRVMRVRHFVVVMCGMMAVADRQNLPGAEARGRRHHGTGQGI